MKNKSCFMCRNQNICKHKATIFDRFEIYHILSDISGFVNLIAEAIGKRCKYYCEYTQEEKEERQL